MLVLKGLVGLHKTIQLQRLQRYYWGTDLDYCDIERFTLEMNRDHSVIFEIASKYCILDSFVDHDGYSVSTEGFLPTVVDIWYSQQKQDQVLTVAQIMNSLLPNSDLN